LPEALILRVVFWGGSASMRLAQEEWKGRMWSWDRPERRIIKKKEV
jgi:hypothetical protein